MNPTKSQAIKKYLERVTHKDLSDLYHIGMECQVNVAQDGGERVDGDFKGRKWHGWTDGLTTWKSFRIPYKAYSKPEYKDAVIKFDLAEHVEAIGMTGWDWQNRCSKWVAFDFDAIVGHSDKHCKKLTNEELEQVKEEASNIDWVTVRRSTSGKGLHLYVFLDDVDTKNHHEHAALARSILGKMSALTGFNFVSKVDSCGGNMWVWHRKMAGTNGLQIIKQGAVLDDIPANWKDHIKVVTGNRRKNLPQSIEESGRADIFEELAGQFPKVQLDSEHRKVINFLKEENPIWWWDQDQNMLVTHTWALKKAHNDLNLKGYFNTTSTGSNLNEQNCFCFPLRRGAWTVRRFTPGVQEHDSWTQDRAGWTHCYLNRDPDLITAARAFGGLEDPTGGFIFREAEIAIKAAQLLGVNVNVAPALMGRKTKLKQHKDGRLIVEVTHDPQDRADEMSNWLPKNKNWVRIYNVSNMSPSEPDVGNFDDISRHLVTESDEDYGWMIKSDNVWRAEPLTHIRIALQSLGHNNKEVTQILGSSIFKAWKVVNKPFQPEYPGNREWNRNAAQLRYKPTIYSNDLKYDNWLSILQHCGKGLDESIKTNAWCRANGILNGADYLKCWIASLFQEPLEPLPYLFFYGPENSGKSIFHEGLSLLLTKGYMRADAALISQAGFNGELEGAIISVVEETNLKKHAVARNRIKDWVTSRQLLIHAKGKTPYHVPNTTHFCQCANNHDHCPVFPGDTRITMSYVDEIDPLTLVPKKKLMPLLEKEAPDFLSEIINLEIPPSPDRLNVPVITTEDKMIVQQLNQTALESFLLEKCEQADGCKIKFSEFYERYIEWLDPEETSRWTKIRIGKELPPQYPKARVRKDGQIYIGNVGWRGSEHNIKEKLIVKDGYFN